VNYHDGTWQGMSGRAKIPLNEWHHVAVVVSPPTIRMYLDGQLDAEKSGVGRLRLNDGPMLIGDAGGYWEYEGLIDEVRIYNRALSPDEVRALYRARPEPK
jgi:hypothetical protein